MLAFFVTFRVPKNIQLVISSALKTSALQDAQRQTRNDSFAVKKEVLNNQAHLQSLISASYDDERFAYEPHFGKRRPRLNMRRQQRPRQSSNFRAAKMSNTCAHTKSVLKITSVWALHCHT